MKKKLNSIKWLSIILIFLLGAINGFLNLWGVDTNDPIKRAKYSKLWHKGMAIMKAVIALMILIIVLLQGNSFKIGLFWALLWFNVSWTIYDFTINCIRFYYEKVASIWRVDDGAINGWIKKYLTVKQIWILRGILIVINLLLLF